MVYIFGFRSSRRTEWVLTSSFFLNYNSSSANKPHFTIRIPFKLGKSERGPMNPGMKYIFGFRSSRRTEWVPRSSFFLNYNSSSEHKPHFTFRIPFKLGKSERGPMNPGMKYIFEFRSSRRTEWVPKSSFFLNFSSSSANKPHFTFRIPFKLGKSEPGPMNPRMKYIFGIRSSRRTEWVPRSSFFLNYNSSKANKPHFTFRIPFKLGKSERGPMNPRMKCIFGFRSSRRTEWVPRSSFFLNYNSSSAHKPHFTFRIPFKLGKSERGPMNPRMKYIFGFRSSRRTEWVPTSSFFLNYNSSKANKPHFTFRIPFKLGKSERGPMNPEMKYIFGFRSSRRTEWIPTSSDSFNLVHVYWFQKLPH
jgi:hypothetical protein